MITITVPSTTHLSLSDELIKYQQLAVGSNIDATLFWKANKLNLKILYRLSKVLLSINPCSANAERNFSVAGLQLIARRAGQHPHRAHKALFLHDNVCLLKK